MLVCRYFLGESHQGHENVPLGVGGRRSVGAEGPQRRRRSAALHSVVATFWLLFAFAAPLSAQEAVPESQDKAPVAEVTVPETQSGADARSGPTNTETPAPAPAPEAAPVAAAPAVVLEAPTPAPVPSESGNGTDTRSDPTGPQTPAATEWTKRGEVVVFGNNVVIRANERASKVVAIGGNVEVLGRVDGELVAVGGDVKIDGPVGKLVAVFGDVTLGPKASVAGEVVAVGGDFSNPDQAPIRGQTVAVGGFLPKFGSMLAWVGNGLAKARLLVPGVAWPWYVFGGFTLFYLLLAAVFGRGVNACARVLEESPGTTLVTAIALLPLLPLFVLLLICTGVGILLLPFLAVAVLFAVAFGKTAVLAFLGRCVLRPCGAATVAENALLTALIGAVLLAVLYCLPWVGVLVWALTLWVGFGMVVATIRENRRREKARIVAQRQAASAAAVSAAVPVASAAAATSVAAESMAAAAFTTPPTAAEGATAPVFEEQAPAPAAPVPPVMSPPMAAVLPEAMSLPRADFWLRCGAILIDIMLVAVAGGVSLVFALLPFPLLFGGYVFALWQWKGTTIGGIVFNLKVVRLDGRPVDAATALVRTLVAFLSVVAAGLGFLWCLWDEEQQTWHDKVAGTVVVRVPKAVSLV